MKDKDAPGTKSFYIYSVTSDEDKAYVYFAAGSSLYQENSENETLYSDYDCTKKMEGDSLAVISEGNYEDYSHYRLVFTKDTNEEGNYLFQKLEKL